MGQAFSNVSSAFVMSLGFQLKHKSHLSRWWMPDAPLAYVRVRLGGITIWRMQCTTCRAVFTVLPHFVFALSSHAPEVARNAALGTHGRLGFRAVRGDVPHFADGALSPGLCTRAPDLVTMLTGVACLAPPSWQTRSTATV